MDDVRDHLMRIAEANEYIMETVHQAYDAKKRLTRDEMFAIISWLASSGDATRKLAMTLFPPRGEA
jgi:hypothetical protein